MNVTNCTMCGQSYEETSEERANEPGRVCNACCRGRENSFPVRGGIANEPHIVAVLGVTGSGKSTWLKRTFLAAPPERLLIWDYSPVQEYARFGQVLGLRDLVTKAGRSPTFRLVFRPRAGNRTLLEKQFAVLCNLAMALGNLTLIVEELRYVTQPSRAPDAWAHVILTGRKVGLTVVGTSQRPAHIDKDFLGNATLLHCGRLIYPADVKACADAMICDPELIRRLDFLEYIEADEQRHLTRGRLTFVGKTASDVREKPTPVSDTDTPPVDPYA